MKAGCGSDAVRTVDALGELALIERLRPRLPVRADILVGAGDDCAVVRPDPNGAVDWVLKSDPVICGRHFQSDADPRWVGHKAMGRVLSDLAAMGAEPRWGLVNLVLPTGTPVAVVDALYDGLLGLAGRHGLAVVGGDTSQGEALALHVFACGCVPRGSARLRSGAVVGDAVFVTGALGGSLGGRHLTFEPRVAEGLWLREWANSMIDISDGLASELWHIARASGVVLGVDAERVPLTAAARAVPPPRTPLDAALSDGEDFELLFTVPEARAVACQAAWTLAFPTLSCTRIGEVTGCCATGEVRLRRCGREEQLRLGGFEHFRGVASQA